MKINEEGFFSKYSFSKQPKIRKNTNLEFNITPYNTENSTNFAHLSYYFNGSNCRRINDIYSGPEFKEIINNLFLSSKEKENDFIRLIFKGYNISVKGGGIYNFLDGQCYKISIIQHLNNPILTCEKSIKMKNSSLPLRLISLFHFLSANRQYNQNPQLKFYKATLLPYETKPEKILALLYNTANTQSQPDIDKLGTFFMALHQHKACVSTMCDFYQTL